MHRKTILMLLTNAYDPDPRVRQEALALIGMGCRIRLLAWDRDLKAPAVECMEGVEVERVFLSSDSAWTGCNSDLHLRMVVPEDAVAWASDPLRCGPLSRPRYTTAWIRVGKQLKRKPVVYDAHESFPDTLHGNVPKPFSKGSCTSKTS